MRKDIEVRDAAELLLNLPAEEKTEEVPIGAMLGRVLAADLRAEIPFPPFDRSPFDGYAFCAADTAGARADAPAALKINQEIPAGHLPQCEAGNGFAAKILTGAPIPGGADTVVKFEVTEFSETEVRIFAPAKPGSNIVRAGEDVPAGTLLAARGSVISPALMGLIAAQGLDRISVYRRPVVTVINTGTELVEPGIPLPPGMIYNSSMATLRGYLEGMGADFRNGGIVADDEALIAARIREAAAESDMVLTTGGASVGDYDCALRAAEYAGADILFWKIRMKPGGSILAYVLNNKPILALSGNPGAAVLGLLRLGLPFLRKLSGRADFALETCEVYLRKGTIKENPRLRLIRGYLEIEEGKAWFVENEGQGGGDISSLINCDLLCEIPEGSPQLPAGSLVKAYRL